MSIVVPLFLVAGTDLSDDVFRKSPDRRAGNVSWGIFYALLRPAAANLYKDGMVLRLKNTRG